ncbi:Cof-type HAD-IIB family hydrolase [Virgibacillus halodenitrificans]|uniref:Cof-type HAD-IIB family hydrolase n=1 Tax=Virgibacillus halodenitrificans TaxID=1482 RepID=UPI00037BA464|nr:Cof-type HAD-IIB family hydrolase [Virgibacillus halodenitrificans]MYL46717.1 HAD-IIB family hydrolase [Virgibacillus halodenitrificans]MYL57974.1 HAD-IIB family hydrolase [Virgibacillus halodenitrificans]
MSKYRLLALDLDETLLTIDKRITDETKKWINKAIAEDIHVVFATGRGLQKIGDFREELGLNSPMVLVNGGEVWGGSNNLLGRYFISKQDIRTLHQLAMEAEAFYWGYSVESLTGPGTWCEEMFHRNWMKFGMRHDDPNVIQQLKCQLENAKTLEITSSGDTNIEFSLKGITKESGIRKVCEHLQLEMKEVLAIGDNLNDLRLIEHAGLGIAMGNGDEKLKAVADGITDTNEKDGVAKAIQRYIFEVNEEVV